MFREGFFHTMPVEGTYRVHASFSGTQVFRVIYEDEGGIMIDNKDRLWWQFWKPKQILRRNYRTELKTPDAEGCYTFEAGETILVAP